MKLNNNLKFNYGKIKDFIDWALQILKEYVDLEVKIQKFNF